MLACFNDIITLSPPINSYYSQVTKLTDNNNVELKVRDNKYNLITNNNSNGIYLDYTLDDIIPYLYFILSTETIIK